MNRLATIKQIEIDKELLRRRAYHNLHAFTRYMWHVIEPETNFVDGWHLHVIAKHLEAVTDFKITKLNINIPPRHMKSILACVMWPAWVWGRYPGRSFIFGSNSATLATRDSLKTRQVILSKEYREVFNHTWGLDDDQNRTDAFKNSRGGVRKSLGVGTTVTGQGGDYLVVDDPHDVQDIYSEAARDKVKFWYDKTLGTRVNNPNQYARVLIMQRLHEDDLSGHVLDKGYESISLPIEFNEKRDDKIKSRTSLGFKDPRTHDGDVLWPQRFNRNSIIELKDTLDDEADAQLQQDPKPKSGGMFPKVDWQYYTSSPSEILESVMFVDAAQKPGVTNDYSVFTTWARTSNGYYLLDIVREKTDGPLLESLTIAAYNKWKHNAVIIEDKSAGSSLIQYLRTQTTIPVIPFDPLQRDKVVRASAAAPTVRAGKCFLPSYQIKGSENGKPVDLVKVFINEHEVFPKGKHDDTVDTTSMMVEYFLRRSTIKPRIRSLV